MTTHPLPGEGGAMPPPLTAVLALTVLAEAAEAYLTALDHPGAGEVGTALACRHGPALPPLPRGNPLVDRWLPEALVSLVPTYPQLAAVILGHLALRREPAGRGMAIAGLVMGYVGIAVTILVLVIFGLVIGTARNSGYGA